MMRFLARHQAHAVALLAAMGAVSTLGFHGAFASWSFLVAVAAGAAGAAGIGLLASARNLLVGESIALSVVAFVVVGVVVVGGVPSPSAVQLFFEGLVSGWADLLTSFTPTDATPELRALPFAIAWIGTLVGVEVLRAVDVPGLAAIGPVATLAAALLFGVEERGLALGQGAAMVAGTLLLALLQQRMLRTDDDDLTVGGATRWRGRGLARAGAVIAVVALAAPLVGPRLPLADANARFDLRDRLEPPFDPLRLPSPLAGVKGDLKEARADVEVLRVTADEPVTRLTSTVLGAYDGVVWTVAASPSAEGGEFRPVGSTFPPPAVEAGEVIEVEVEVLDLHDHWLPRPGAPVAVAFEEGPRDLRLNRDSGNIALPDQIGPGDQYSITAHSVVELSPSALASATVEGSIEEGAGLSALPPVIRTAAADLLEGEDTGMGQVVALQEAMVSRGFYDTSDLTPPGHTYFRIADFLADPDALTGFEEQYAAAAGVVARVAGVPARVVVGYLIPEERYVNDTATVVAGDRSAWIEVRTVEHGWVPVDVTPDTSRTPDAEQASRTVEDVAVPEPPPPPPPPPDVEEEPSDELEDAEAEEAEEEQEAEESGLSPTLLIAAAIGSPFLLLALLGALVVAVKTRRRRRRREHDDTAVRVAGAWAELVERGREAGLEVGSSTPRETVQRWSTDNPAGSEAMLALATAVDRAAFHPDPPAEDVAAEAWAHSDAATAALLRDHGVVRRTRMRLDPRTLIEVKERR